MALTARNSAFSIALPAGLIWMTACLIAVGFGITRDGLWQVPLFLGSASAAVFIWRKWLWPDPWSRYLSFAATVLIACILNRILYLTDFMFSGERFELVGKVSQMPEWSVFKAEIVTILGTGITVLVWLAAGGAKYSPNLLLHAPRQDTDRTLIILYVASLLTLVITRMLGADARMLGEFTPSIVMLGMSSAFFLPIMTTRPRSSRIVLATILVLPFLWFSMTTGMKENIIISLLPVGLIVWILFPSAAHRLAIIVVAVLFLGLMTPYASYYRSVAWGTVETVTQQQALSGFAAKVEQEGLGATVAEGIKGFAQRGNAATYRGWAIALADERRHEPELIFAPLGYVFIPRMIWPEKPKIRQGWEYGRLVFGENSTIGDSSISAGLYPAFYLGYGWPAVIGGAIAIALMLVVLLKVAWRIGGGLLVGLFNFSMLPFALRLDEKWTVGVLSGPIINLAYIIAILMIARFAGAVMAAKSRSRSGPSLTASKPFPRNFRN